MSEDEVSSEESSEERDLEEDEGIQRIIAASKKISEIENGDEETDDNEEEDEDNEDNEEADDNEEEEEEEEDEPVIQPPKKKIDLTNLTPLILPPLTTGQTPKTSKPPVLKVISPKTSESVPTTSTSDVKPKLKDYNKSIIIQPADKEEIKAMVSGIPKKNSDKPSIVIIPLSPVNKSKKKSTMTLDEALVKEDTETDEAFLMRNAYSRTSAQIFPETNVPTHVLLGRLAVQRAQYGVTFPEDITAVMDYIDKQILRK